MIDDRCSANAERLAAEHTAWEHQQREYAHRQRDAADAAWFLVYAIAAAFALALWHELAEWFFGRLG